MRLGILCNGVVDDYDWLAEIVGGLDGLICADGGADHALKAGLSPLVIIGDLDSITDDTLSRFQDRGVKVIKYPPEKDQTDLQLAIKEAIAMGAKEIVLLGATGKRIDHLLGNVSVLADILTQGVAGVILDQWNEISLHASSAVVYGFPGDTLSLLPLTSTVTGITTENLKYPLVNGTFSLGNPYGISNVLTSSKAIVNFEQGLLLVIKPK